ncbi:MAG: hypothetical protein QOI80_2447 [Solirubrobacteraceae bacterium]|jgi:hypothetical protein|nr:hypothetical protein [Solirubrobacteraceae bacterium]
MRAMRRLLPVLVGIVLVGAGLFGLLALFHDRDSANLSARTAAGPGVLETTPGDPPTSGATGGDLQQEGEVENPVLLKALSIGDVALVYGSADPPAELTQVREDATGPFDPELAAAGQMAFLVHRKGVTGVQALAWKRRLEVPGPSDPRLREFIDTWLGKGEGGTG